VRAGSGRRRRIPLGGFVNTTSELISAASKLLRCCVKIGLPQRIPEQPHSLLQVGGMARRRIVGAPPLLHVGWRSAAPGCQTKSAPASCRVIALLLWLACQYTAVAHTLTCRRRTFKGRGRCCRVHPPTDGALGARGNNLSTSAGNRLTMAESMPLALDLPSTFARREA